MSAAPARPSAFHVMTKPIGPVCNLDCAYCFYLEKERLYPGNHRWRMPDDVLEAYIRQYIAAQSVPEVQFAWQGGEPTLMGVEFFERVVELQRRYSGGKRIRNAIQTNGTLLSDEWGEFFRRNEFLVGVSLDGPRELHDAYRTDKQGGPTFDRVLRGIAVLKQHGVEFNTLTVVNRLNSKRPLDVYAFLKEVGSGFIQFIPLVERRAPGGAGLAGPPSLPAGAGAEVTDWSVLPDDYGRFLCAIFDEWVKRDVGRVFVQMFDTALASWCKMGPGLCVFAERCGTALALEHNGDLYSCDHYVYPEFRLGNLCETPLAALVASPQQSRFGADKLDTLPKYCLDCDVRFACNGECPKHRFLSTPDGEPGLNYLCAAYKRFFRHVDPAMRRMKQLLDAGRAPAEIMADGSAAVRAPHRAVGRNDPCPCGSGRKYKRCCLGRT